MVKMYKGRCPHCGKITPVPKDKWYRSVKCQWCGSKFVPFATAQQAPTPQMVYKKKRISKSLEAVQEKITGRKVA